MFKIENMTEDRKTKGTPLKTTNTFYVRTPKNEAMHHIKYHFY